MLLEKTYEISCIFEKTSYLCNQEKKVFAGCPDAPACSLKKITASSDGMSLSELFFYVQSKTAKDAKHLGLTSFDFLPSNDG